MVSTGIGPRNHADARRIGRSSEQREQRNTRKRLSNKVQLDALVSRATRDVGCSAGARTVLVALFRHMGGRKPWEPFWCTHEQIMGMAGVSRRTVQRALTALQEAGIVVREYTPGPRDQTAKRPSWYRFVQASDQATDTPSTDAPEEQPAAAAEAPEPPPAEQSDRRQIDSHCVPDPGSSGTLGSGGNPSTAAIGPDHPAEGGSHAPRTVGPRAPQGARASVPLIASQTAAGPSRAPHAPTPSLASLRSGGELRSPSPFASDPHLGEQAPNDSRPWRRRTQDAPPPDPPRNVLARFATQWLQAHRVDVAAKRRELEVAHGPRCTCSDCHARRMGR